MEDSLFGVRVIFNALTEFFSNGVWVVLFFFLLNKMYDGPVIKKVSSIMMLLVLVFYLIYCVVNSM